LIWHNASDHAGNMDPNAGFLRDEASLAILLLTDEEDMSVQNPRYVRAGIDPPTRPNALDVYNVNSRAWGSPDLNLRTYLYASCSAQDPTWPIDRYVTTADPSRGLPGLKPGHPERVAFAAITGVPIVGDGLPQHADGTTDWNGLLGTPGPNGPDDYCGRNAGPGSASVNTMSAEGAISMRQDNPDPNCSTRTVPACRRQGTRDNPSMPACTTMTQYFAWPARRIVEVARRFDESPLCNGAPCHAGAVISICGNDYASAMTTVVNLIAGQHR
jgi:hypothetical protein